MTPRPVHWHEGMFLRPHHFQAADRFAARVLAQNVGLVRSHGWGLGRCVIDPEALGGFRLVVRELDARFRDGTTISLPDDGPLPDLDLKPAFADRTSLDVIIAHSEVAAGPAEPARADRDRPGPLPGRALAGR